MNLKKLLNEFRFITFQQVKNTLCIPNACISIQNDFSVQ